VSEAILFDQVSRVVGSHDNTGSAGDRLYTIVRRAQPTSRATAAMSSSDARWYGRRPEQRARCPCARRASRGEAVRKKTKASIARGRGW